MSGSVVALSGGVGGAKLALGLSHVVSGEALVLIGNTGDDFEHFGLTICPDLDTLTYTLAGLANPETGWGRDRESWALLETLKALGGEDWFLLGDRDMALHILRSHRLRSGDALSAVTDAIRLRLGIEARILPMSDDPVRTTVETQDGPLAFQHYFVRERCAPRVTGFRFDGAEAAIPAPGAVDALTAPDLAATVLCPSNPFISIDPILAVPGFRSAMRDGRAPVIAVSPIVGGAAIKGPTAKMLTELGLDSSATAIAKHYAGLIDGFVLDERDAALAEEIEALGPAVRIAQTLMRSLDDRIALAETCLAFAADLRKAAPARQHGVNCDTERAS